MMFSFVGERMVVLPGDLEFPPFVPGDRRGAIYR
jgi:hypothetical protein